MKSLLLAAIIAVAITAPTRAGFDEGVAAHKRGDWAKAFREFEILAEQGLADGQYGLGVMYDRGEGVPQDYAEAARWYRKAAEQGHSDAQHNLGVMYKEGLSVAQDYGEALRWFRKAAEQGSANAQYAIGLIYDEGLGIPQDHAEAAKWYREAAGQGIPEAQNNLGVHYHYGQGISQDLELAYLLYGTAALNFALAGLERDRELAAYNRDLVAKQMTSAQVAEAKRLGSECLRTTSSSDMTLPTDTLAALSFDCLDEGR